MAGYNGYSMSNNAVTAYEDGERPLSKWTKAAVIERIEQLIEDCGVELRIDKTALFALRAPALKMLVLRKASWHHTSSWYNATEFYDVSIPALEALTGEDLADAAERKPAPEEPKEDRWLCEYLEWSGTRKHPKATTCTAEGVIRGDWFFLSDGSKKKVTARGFRRLRRVDA